MKRFGTNKEDNMAKTATKVAETANTVRPSFAIADSIQPSGDRLPKLGNYFGEYLLEATGHKHQKGTKGEFIIAEFKVLESKGENAATAGLPVAFLFRLNGKYPESDMKEVMRYVAAISNIKPEEVKGYMLETLVGDENPGKGEKVRAIVAPKDPSDLKSWPVVKFFSV